ncbi:MAG: hypothetical protein CMJ64_24870 [Planctomycetaceae bacterium]|nr:hypothetical protein [Planctomycetaceae bacterium]
MLFGTACRDFMDKQMRGWKLTHLQFDEQHSTVYKKQSRLTISEKAERHDIGEVYIWTCIDEQTKLMPSFLIGKRSADNARRFLMDVAGRLSRPAPHTSDAHAFAKGGYRAIVQVSADGWAGYPEAVDLAFVSVRIARACNAWLCCVGRCFRAFLRRRGRNVYDSCVVVKIPLLFSLLISF